MDRRWLAVVVALLAALSVGCDRLVFGYLNRGIDARGESYVYDRDAGLSLDVFAPDRLTANTAPVVVFFYGGAWQRGARAQYRFVGARLAERGVVAIVADYRTYPRATFPGFVEDAARAVAWARVHAREHGGDPDRLFVAGHSAGAHIAALVASDARYLSRVGLAPCRLAGAIGLSGAYDFDIEGELERVFGPRAQWPDAMPVRFVDGDEPPFLLVHGDADERVAVRNSVAMADALRTHGVPVELELRPDGRHRTPLAGLYRPKRYPDIVPMLVRFIERTPAARCASR